MKKINISKVSNWMHRNARELELAIWKYHFENGGKQEVLNALMHYQNDDGGFGNSIDPDNWNLNSLPYATVFAIKVLKDISFFDMQHPVHVGIKKYFDNTSVNDWTFTVATNKDFPHASYYKYDENYNKTESLGILCEFCSYIVLHYNEIDKYTKILCLIDELMTKFSENNLGDMGVTGYMALIDAMRHAHFEGYDFNDLDLRLKKLVYNSIQRNPSQWAYYGYRPSDYIKSSKSIFYDDNKDIIDIELDFLVDTLPKNNVWDVSWSWFENNEKYSSQSAISLNWDKSIKAIERVRFLKNFERLSND